jgi:transcriptional regulator with XRE-family HTH domain
MVERILSVLKYKDKTPAQFADEIGVQRSSISHLVSGRNKPSLEFVIKILQCYQEINPEWLLTGSGPMIKNKVPVTLREVIKEEPADRTVSLNDKPVEREISVTPGNQRKRLVDPDKSQTEKIVCLFKDKTFREYFPE